MFNSAEAKYKNFQDKNCPAEVVLVTYRLLNRILS